MDLEELYRNEVRRSLRLEEEIGKLNALVVAIVNKLGEVALEDEDFIDGTVRFDNKDEKLVLTLEKNE